MDQNQDCQMIGEFSRNRKKREKSLLEGQIDNDKMSQFMKENGDVLSSVDNIFLSADGTFDFPVSEKKKKETDKFADYETEENSLHDRIKDTMIYERHCKKREKKAEEKLDISMQEIERFVLEKVRIKFYHGTCYMYNDKNWVQIPKNELLSTIRSVLPSEVVDAISHMRSYSEAAEYMKINKKLEIAESEMHNLAHNTLISCKNCVIDARTLKTCEHSPKYLLFFSCRFVYKKNPGNTPTWDKFLNHISSDDPTVATLIKEMIGYLMLHSNDAKAFFVMGTAPDSGKTVLGQWIAKLFDPQNVAHIPLQEMGSRFALSRAANIALNICMDISAKKIPNDAVGMMKQITGENEILIEQKYQINEDICHHFHCLYGTNADISLAKNDDAFFNRLVFIPFTRTIPRHEQDKTLVEKLLAETDDFASKCVHAVHKVIERNYVFTETKGGQRTIHAWSGNVTPSVVQVVDECFRFSRDEDDILSTMKCYEVYRDKCQECGYTAIGYDLFKSYMENAMGLKYKRSRIDGNKNPISCLTGIQIKEESKSMIVPVTRT